MDPATHCLSVINAVDHPPMIWLTLAGHVRHRRHVMEEPQGAIARPDDRVAEEESRTYTCRAENVV
jgi:hypothetical protein